MGNQNKFVIKIICLTISVLFLWNTTYAVSSYSMNGVTISDLKKRYPQARFHPVSPDEFSKAEDRLENQGILFVKSQDVIPAAQSKKTVGSNKMITCNELIQKFPNTRFYPADLETFPIVVFSFNHSGLIILHTGMSNSYVSPDKLTFDTFCEENQSVLFHVYYAKTQDDFQKIRAGIKGGNVFIAEVDRSKIEKEQAEEQNNALPQETSSNKSQSSGHFNVTGSCIGDLPDLGNDEVAVVLYIVIGIFIAAVLIIYAGKYIYDTSIKKKERDYWWDATVVGTVFEKGGNNGFKETGTAGGIRVITGFTDKNLQIGLASEIGWFDSKLQFDNTEDEVDLDGVYGMVGPTIRLLISNNYYRQNPSCLSFELLAGASEHIHSGLMSVARAGVIFGIHKNVRLGFHIGSLYFELDETDSIVQSKDNFRLIFSTEVGWQF